MAVVSMTDLLEVGVHFGHQTKRWHPRMKPYIYTSRNGIHIINMQKTIQAIQDTFNAIRHVVMSGQSILFIGTKKQAQKAIEEEATKCGMYYINQRWLGGMLTNFSTIKKSISQLKAIEKSEVDGTFDSMTQKEVSRTQRVKNSLQRNLSGIKDMQSLPGMVFIVDPRKEYIAVQEALRMKIPIAAIVDTNCDPTNITYPIPGNDDAIRSIALFTHIIAQAVMEADNEVGLEVIETLQEENRSVDMEEMLAANITDSTTDEPYVIESHEKDEITLEIAAEPELADASSSADAGSSATVEEHGSQEEVE